MKYTTHKGKTYTVTTIEPCTITSDTGILLCTADPGKQASFVAIGSTIEVDSESAEITENATKASGLNAGTDIQFTGNLYKTTSSTLTEESILNQEEGDMRWQTAYDTVPTSGSTNAVTSGGLYNVLFARELALGRATATGNSSIAVGYSAESTSMASTAIGCNAKAKHVGAMALGNACQAINWQSIAIGSFVSVRVNSANKEVGSTFFYIIPAGSTLSEIYENGEACLGYVVKDIDNNIVACGTRKLCDLLTNNTAFAPAALDLDAPAPTPFLPTGIMEPIESLNESNV